MRCPRRTVQTLLFAVLASFPTIWVNAQAPDSLSFQGYLTDSGGAPLDATVSIAFKLYDGSTDIWMETQPSVTVSNGVFNVLLGSVTPLDTVAFDRPLELGITVGGDAEMSPRTPLAAAAYAKALPGFYTFYREEGVWKGYNIVGGSANNIVGSEVIGATISGGGAILVSTNPYPNQVLGNFGTIGGGIGNTASGVQATVGGGSTNTAGESATVGGGQINSAGGDKATIGGGIQNTASGANATIGGGSNNSAGGSATVGGGQGNIASGTFATIPGGVGNRASQTGSFAAGENAKAVHDGSFVWNDRSSATTFDSLFSTAENQFLARASGGFTFYTKSNNTTGVVLASNLGAWASVSDVDAKTGFRATEPTLVLERLSRVPIRTWRYKGQDESITHMGPTSQDFYEAFGLGIDDRHIVTVDADGVALAAIQGLYELVKAQQGEIKRMQTVIEEILGDNR